jgi:hypothetical protein
VKGSIYPAMLRGMKKLHVEWAYSCAAEGRQLIADYEQMVARLRRSGSEILAKKAEGFLWALLRYQARFEEHLARLETSPGPDRRTWFSQTSVIVETCGGGTDGS